MDKNPFNYSFIESCRKVLTHNCSHSLDFFTTYSERNYNEYVALIIEIDIENSNGEGFYVAKRIKKANNIPVIFTTIHDKYAIDGYLNDAFALLIKSKTQYYIKAIIEKLLQYLKRKYTCILVTEKSNSMVERLLSLDDIYCIYTQGNYVLICNSAKEYRKRTSVRKIMSYLSNDFFEISRGQVININKVVEIKKDDCSIIMKNKDKVFASKKRLNELINILDRNACGYKG